jgi:endonuclease/exonuclease/phosphatase family metal-dependent hydrolase
MIPDPDPKLFANDYYETRCILKILLKGGITVLVTHFGLNSDEHECAVRAIFENLCDEKCILMGDFNVTPSNPVLNIIRDKMVDTADFFTEEQLSFPSDNPNRKIDYIFVSHDIEVISAEIPGLVVSDHRPYTATIKV